MKQRYDLVAFALLAFACVFLVAIVQSPKEFKISEWQPLMAAILTLGGAGIVYRGATLAYRAAMAKVEFDKSIAERDDARRRLSSYIKVGVAAYDLEHEAKILLKRLRKPTIGRFRMVDLSEVIHLTEPKGLTDAWDSLEVFPMVVTREMARIRDMLYNLNLARTREKTEHDIVQVGPDRFPIESARGACEIIVSSCQRIRGRLRPETERLYEYE